LQVGSRGFAPARILLARILRKQRRDGLVDPLLGILARGGLVRSERHSRSIIYRADLDGLRALTLFLVKDCCAGNAELCAPLIAELTPCC